MFHPSFTQTDLPSLPNSFQKSVSDKIINSAQRIERRRNKKKKMERRRRKKISENLTKVHEFALGIIGIDNPKENKNVHLEKTEMLEFCYDVLSRLNDFLGESPDLQKRFRITFKGKNVNTIAPHDDAEPSFDSGFHDVAPDFNEEFTSSSNSFMDHKVKPSAQPKKLQKIWRPYI